MNFKLNDFKELLLDKKGLIPIALAFGLQIAIYILFIIPFIFIIILMGDPFGTDIDPMSSLGIGMALFLVAFVLLAIPIGILTQAGVYGSLKQILKGKDFQFKDFFTNMKTYFLPVLGYSLIYLMLVFFLFIPFVFFVGFVSTFIPVVGIFIEFISLVVVMAVTILLSPLLYLSVVKGSKIEHIKKLYKNYGNELLVVAFVFGFFMSIPFLSMIFNLVIILLPAYVLLLFYSKDENVSDTIERPEVSI